MFKWLISLVFVVAFGTLAPAAVAAQGDDITAAVEARTDIDVALERFLSAEGDALILLPHRLDRNRLDFSVESLEHVDDWLQGIHTINRLEAGEGRAGPMFTMDGRGDNSVMFAGLYLGEVVRLNSKQKWVWQPFEAVIANNPAHASVLGDEAGFDTYLLVSEQGVATPLNAALKRVLNGSIDSVHYIATFLMEPVDLDKAMTGTDFGTMPPVSAQ